MNRCTPHENYHPCAACALESGHQPIFYPADSKHAFRRMEFGQEIDKRFKRFAGPFFAELVSAGANPKELMQLLVENIHNLEMTTIISWGHNDFQKAAEEAEGEGE